MLKLENAALQDNGTEKNRFVNVSTNHVANTVSVVLTILGDRLKRCFTSVRFELHVFDIFTTLVNAFMTFLTAWAVTSLVLR